MQQVQCIEKERQKNGSMLTPNCKQRRGHHSSSAVICCTVLLLIVLTYCLSGSVRKKSWLNSSKDKWSQDFILDGRYVRSKSVLWSHCFNLLFRYITYIPEEANETTSERKASNLWWLTFLHVNVHNLWGEPALIFLIFMRK